MRMAAVGSSGKTAAYANGLLYVRESSSNEILDSANGNRGRQFFFCPDSGVIDANRLLPERRSSAGDPVSRAPMRSCGTLQAQSCLVSAPIVINDVVIVGSASGNVYAVDTSTGSQIWNGNAGSGIAGPDEVSGAQMTGFGAGEGYLMVPAGNKLTAWRISGP